MSNSSYRIRTESYSGDQHIKVKLDQHYDQFNILSLTLKPADTWANRCSNFGVVVGRVTANKGFGVPNAKVSIFIPLTAEDEYNPEIVARYPYKTVTDKRDGIRYNLLPSIKQSATHTPVGNFPTKEEILRDDLWLEIYQKYYRFTTRTNEAGDFMFYGVPTGTYVIHYDIDISDIGDLSVVPFELIAQGQSEQKFDGPYKFKASTDLDSLAQIISLDRTITVQPFWGSKDLCDVQITRSDFDLTDKGVELKQYALFIGSSVTDSENNWINQRCKVKKHVGEQSQLQTMPGKIEILTLADGNGDNVPDSVEFLDIPTAVIDENGVWAFLIELNGQRIMTDEFGNEIVSPSISQGVIKNGFFRFKFSIGPETDEVKYRAKYIVPNNGIHQYAYLFNRLDVDYIDDTGNVAGTIPGFNSLGDIDSPGVDSNGYYHCGPLFREFTRKKIYTVRNYIPRYLKNTMWVTRETTPRCLGLKHVDIEKAKVPIPYNRMDPSTGFLYDLVCVLYSILFTIVAGINYVIYALNAIIDLLNNIIYGIISFICGIVSVLNSILSAIVNAINAVACPGTLFTVAGIDIGWCFFTVGPWQINASGFCPATQNAIPYIDYISWECCSNCDQTGCNCYIPFYDCYSNVSVCEGSSNVAGGKTLKRCVSWALTSGGNSECLEMCLQQQQGSATNETKQACIDNKDTSNPNNPQVGACSNLENPAYNIGTAGYEEHVYSFCTDSLKQCMLGEYVCDSEELQLEFWNAWISGLLFFPQIQYKERVSASGKLKKAKFCDADWNSAVQVPVSILPPIFAYLYPSTHPFRNDSYDTMITERRLFQDSGFPIYQYSDILVSAGLVKYWPRQMDPPLGWLGLNNNKNDYVKGPFDDIYYNARQYKRPLGFEDTPSTWDQSYPNILLATEILSLGSYLVTDDPDNAPFFIHKVPATTYKRPENLTSFFCFSCTDITPNDGFTGIRLHEKICEFGAEFNDEEDTFFTNLYNGQISTYDLFVDEAFHSGRTYITTMNTVLDTSNQPVQLNYGDGGIPPVPPTLDLTQSVLYGGDEIDDTTPGQADQIFFNQMKGIWETRLSNNGDTYVKYQSNPFYMYYGLHPGKTAIDIVHDKFIPKDICNQ